MSTPSTNDVASQSDVLLIGDVPMTDDVELESNAPYIGQQFDSEEVAYEFYNTYAARVGFGVRKGYWHKHKITGIVLDRMFFCAKAGEKEHDPRRTYAKKAKHVTRCACEAHMQIKLDRERGVYVVKSFKGDHNHQPQPKDVVHMIRSHRNFHPSQAAIAETAIKSGLSLKDTFEFMGNEVGGVENLGFLKEDLKRHLQTKRQRSLKYGEAAALLDYFQEQRGKNPAFYSAYLLDHEEQITNIFWADAKMIMDYANFGDVLVFDTTYKTNNCHRPCAMFAGLTNHRKTTIFGGALLYDETSASFAWLFKTFLLCMGGKKPKTIFTDQAQAIANGLEVVMPETKHCLCTWHLTQNLRKHFGYKICDKIVPMWHDVMHLSMSPEQFDRVWKLFVDHHDIADSPWFKSKYELRKKWAKAFLKDTLTLGMESTQLSEKLNACMKDNLKPTVNIPDFFLHFEKVVNKKRYQERKMVYEGRHKFLSLRLKLSPMLSHASQVYTMPMFDRFHTEYDEAAGLVAQVIEDSEGGCLYHVSRYDEMDNVYEVFCSKERETVYCSCARYEMCGYLCCHCLKILDKLDIKAIPSAYILKRWTKDAVGELVLDFNGLKIVAQPQKMVSQRYHSLCPNLVTMATVAAQCKKATEYFADVLVPINTKLHAICLEEKDDDDMSLGDPSAYKINGYRIPARIKARGVAKNKGDKSWVRPRGWYEVCTGKKTRQSIIASNINAAQGTIDEPSNVQVSQHLDSQTSQVIDEEEFYVPTAGGTTYFTPTHNGNLFGITSDGFDIVDGQPTTRRYFSALLESMDEDARS